MILQAADRFPQIRNILHLPRQIFQQPLLLHVQLPDVEPQDRYFLLYLGNSKKTYLGISKRMRQLFLQAGDLCPQLLRLVVSREVHPCAAFALGVVFGLLLLRRPFPQALFNLSDVRAAATSTEPRDEGESLAIPASLV